MPGRRQSLSINPNQWSRDATTGPTWVGNPQAAARRRAPTNPNDYILTQPDQALDSNPNPAPESDPVTQAVGRFKETVGRPVADFAAGAAFDNPAFDSKWDPRTQSSARTAGGMAMAALPVLGMVGEAKPAFTEAMAMAKNRLGLEGLEAGGFAKSLGKFGTQDLERLNMFGGKGDWQAMGDAARMGTGERTDMMRSVINDVGPANLALKEPVSVDTAARDALRRRGIVGSGADRVMLNAGPGTRNEIQYISDLPTNERVSLQNQINQEAAGWSPHGSSGSDPNSMGFIPSPPRAARGPFPRPQADEIAVRTMLRHQGFPDASADVIINNMGSDTGHDILNMRGMGPTDEGDMLAKLHRREAGIGPGAFQMPAPVGQAGIARGRAPNIIIPGRSQAARAAAAPQGRMVSANALPGAWDNPDYIPTIGELIGDHRSMGRMGLGGMSSKRVLAAPGGLEYLHKGTPFGGVGNSETERIISGSQGQHLGSIIDEEAGTRFSNLINQKTPVAVQTKEGGTLQKMVPNMKAMEDMRWMEKDDPRLWSQMSAEQPVDTLGQISDRHSGQFFWDENKGLMIPGDKGINSLDEYKGGPMRSWGGHSDVATYYNTYGEMERGGQFNKYMDPNAGHETISRIEQIPEADYRKALSPIKRLRGGMSDSEFDDTVRGFMGEIPTLRQRFTDYYRRHQP